MKIQFCFPWYKSSSPARSFKSKGGYDLFDEYLKRLQPFNDAGAGPLPTAGAAGTRRWLCDALRAKTPLSSEALAEKIQTLRNGGVRRLEILIGGADGFSQADIDSLRPDFVWSFGPMTLPHELAAVVAAEQVYRAVTILENHPYHSGH